MVFTLLQVTCLDISSGGGLGVSASTDGTMKIWQAANGEIRVRASSVDYGHLLKWFSRDFSQSSHMVCSRVGKIWLLIEKLVEIWYLGGFKANA